MLPLRGELTWEVRHVVEGRGDRREVRRSRAGPRLDTTAIAFVHCGHSMGTGRQGRAKAPPDMVETNGEAAARFDRLYREHVDRIYRFAQRLCGPGEDARDLVQDTFLNAYRGLKDFRGEAQLSTWLYTIATRACMRMRRRRKGEPERELSLEECLPTSEGELHLQIQTSGLSPEEALENKELRRALQKAIEALPRKYQLVLVLRDMEGLSAKEVATIMAMNERAVKSRLHRARLFVRRELSARGLARATRRPSPPR